MQEEDDDLLRTFDGASIEPSFELALADILADDQLYAAVDTRMIVVLNPEPVVHPYVYTQLEDDALTVDSDVGDCSIVAAFDSVDLELQDEARFTGR